MIDYLSMDTFTRFSLILKEIIINNCYKYIAAKVTHHRLKRKKENYL